MTKPCRSTSWSSGDRSRRPMEIARSPDDWGVRSCRSVSAPRTITAMALAIVLEAVIRIGKRSLKNNVMRGLAAAAFVGIFFLDVPFPVIILAAAVIGFFGGRAGLPQFAVGSGHGPAKNGADPEDLLGETLPDHARPTVRRALRASAVWLLLWLVPLAAVLWAFGEANVYSQIAIFFSKMAMVTFGGAYAVLAYVAQQAVEHYGWL